jgi:uncharacterized membrane protein
MRNFIAVVFDGRGKAYKGLHALWELDNDWEITVHGTAVIHRDDLGGIVVDTKETLPGAGTAVGVGIGALLGALAGPAGAAIGAAGGAAVGAAAGGAVGVAADLDRDDLRQQALHETRFVLGIGQSAVIADVSEDSTSPINTRMHSLGGKVYRRARGDLRDDAWFGSGGYFYPYESYLYPYEYIPPEYL